MKTSIKKISEFTSSHIVAALLVAGLLAAFVVPRIIQMIELSELETIVELISADLRYAGNQSKKHNIDISVAFDATHQCYGMVDNKGGCSCYGAIDCEVMGVRRVVKIDSYQNVVLDKALFEGSSFTVFNSINGKPRPGFVTVSTTDDKKLRLLLSAQGKITICYPKGDVEVFGYNECFL